MVHLISSKFLWSAFTFIFFFGSFFGSESVYGKVFFPNSEELPHRAQRIPQQAAAFQLGFQAEEILLQRGDPAAAIALGRQVIELDPENAVTIGQMFDTYSYAYFTGDEDHPRNITQAFDLCLEAARVGYADSGTHLDLYTRAILCGSDGFDQDIPTALGFYTRVVEAGVDQALIGCVRNVFRGYINELFNVSKRYRDAIDMLRRLQNIEPGNEAHRQNLATCLEAYAAGKFFGNADISQNVDEAIEFCREAARLGSSSAQRRLGDFSDDLYLGKTAGIAASKSCAISLLREALSYNSTPGGRKNLGIMLKEHALALFKESNSERLKMEEAIELMRESAGLGNEYAARLLPQLQDFTRSHSMGM